MNPANLGDGAPSVGGRCISLTLLCVHQTPTVAVIAAVAAYIVPVIAGVAVGAAGFRVVSNGMY
jgi:hypothetical protein